MFELLAENQTARVAFLAILFLAVAFMAYFVARSSSLRRATRQRLEAVAAPTTTARDPMTVASLRGEDRQTRWIELVNAIERTGVNLIDTRDETLRRKLVMAGYTSPEAPKVYVAIRLIGVFLLPAILVGYMYLVGELPGLAVLYFTVVIAAAMGLYLPALYVTARADRRATAIMNGFPDSLDLMLVCVEAGLGLDTAFSRVGQEMARSHPLLADMFGTVVLEMRAGRSREDALRRMADRAGVDEIRAFATLLIQSTKLGSSVAQTLRTYANEMREKRRLRAEEKAHRLPVLLSIPLVGCMLPTMIGVLMVPAVIRVVRIIGPALGGD